MKKLNSILSIISLCITSFLLVLLVFAWYATNKQANVNDGVGSVADLDGIIDSVTYYNFKSKATVGENTVFTIQDCTQFTVEDDQSKESNEVEMNKYELVPSSTYSTEYLIRIKFKDPVDLTTFNVSSQVNIFPGFENTTYPGYVLTNQNIPLSALVNFRVYPGSGDIVITKTYGDYTDTEDEGDTFTIPTSTFSGCTPLTFDLNDSTHFLVTKIDFNTTPITNVTEVYIIIDYDLDRMNELYSNNLGNDDFDTSDPSFKTSFYFMIAGNGVMSS